MTAKTLEERIQRVEDFQQIQNIMGRYAYYVMGNRELIEKELFTQKNPTFRIYLGEQGYWEGVDAYKRAYSGPRPDGPAGSAAAPDAPPKGNRVGSLVIHAPICPVIEIAGDGKTAKGVWIGIGLLGEKNRETGEPEGIWEWDKYGVDFIKEDGKWKIWHHHIYRLLHGWKVDKKWADQFRSPEVFRTSNPDGPAIDDNPYTPDTVQKLVPEPPEPYETWADTTPY